MKRFVAIALCLITLICLSVFAFGCSSGIEGGKTYYSYAYDMATARFVKSGSSLRFSKDMKSYTFSFAGDNVSVSGGVQKYSKPNCYVISCSEDVVSVIENRYRNYLVQSGADETMLQLFDVFRESFSPKQQMFVSGEFMFTSKNVEMSHVVGTGVKSSDFSGEYIISSSGEKVKFADGVMYSKNASSAYEKCGRYTVSNNLMTVTTTNADGSDKYDGGVLMSKRYLMAKVTFPENVNVISTDFEEIMKSSDWYGVLSDNLNAYAGKTVCVLVDGFYAQKA